MITVRDWMAAIFYQRITQFVTWPIHQGAMNHFWQNYNCPSGTHVLDIGCGTGYYSPIFSETGYVGLDVSY